MRSAQGIDLARFGKERAQGDHRRRGTQAREAEAEQFEKAFLADVGAAGGGRRDAPPVGSGRPGGAGPLAHHERLGLRGVPRQLRPARVPLRQVVLRERDLAGAARPRSSAGSRPGVFYRQADGSIWARLEPLGLQDKVLLRSDGTTVYITQDIGTAIRKFEDYRMDRSLYVVGGGAGCPLPEPLRHPRSSSGTTWAGRCAHVSYAMVNLARGHGEAQVARGEGGRRRRPPRRPARDGQGEDHRGGPDRDARRPSTPRPSRSARGRSSSTSCR